MSDGVSGVLREGSPGRPRRCMDSHSRWAVCSADTLLPPLLALFVRVLVCECECVCLMRCKNPTVMPLLPGTHTHTHSLILAHPPHPSRVGDIVTIDKLVTGISSFLLCSFFSCASPIIPSDTLFLCFVLLTHSCHTHLFLPFFALTKALAEG